MNYDIETRVEKDYLVAIISGEQTFEDNIKLVSFLIEKCVSEEVDKVVLDIRGMWGQPGVVSDFTLANFAATEALGKVRSVAIIYRPDTYIYTSFFETASRNRGLNMRAFQNENEAIEWISQS